MTESLAQLTDRLEAAAARLRDPALPPEDAAALVQECARLAGDAASALDREARAAAAEPGDVPPDQESLL